jgi:copper chaperone NosL
MRFFGIAILIVLLADSPALSGEQKPVKPSPRDKCPVCGMFVAKYPDFLAQILFTDGYYALFDGAKDMFKFYSNMKKYDTSRKPADISKIYVTDYYDLTFINGFEAFYVVGSDVYGPMGRELIPFKTEAAARDFMKDHNGKSMLRFKEVTAEVINGLD